MAQPLMFMIMMNMKKLVARYKCKISTILYEKKGNK